MKREEAPDSVIFRVVAVVTFFLINLVALYLFLRGHNAPGGGFIAGLATGLSFVLLGIAHGVNTLRNIMGINPARLFIIGLGIALATAIGSWVAGISFFEHRFFDFYGVPLLGDVHIGTPFFFDLGVYFVVVGITIKVIGALTNSVNKIDPFPDEEVLRFAAEDEVPVEQATQNEAGEQTKGAA